MIAFTCTKCFENCTVRHFVDEQQLCDICMWKHLKKMGAYLPRRIALPKWYIAGPVRGTPYPVNTSGIKMPPHATRPQKALPDRQ